MVTRHDGTHFRMGDLSSMRTGPGSRKSRPAWRALFLLSALPGCAATEVELRRPDGSVAARGALAGRDQDGPWEHRYENGQRESAGAYRRDVRDGPWQFWYADGTPRQAGTYAEDRQVGLWRFWHANGQLACRGEYRAGREHGEWLFFHDNGRLQQRGCFVDGKRMLQWTTFDREGLLRTAGPCFADQACDLWTESKDGGVVQVRHPSPPGLRWHIETWDDGTVRREGFLREGVPDGLWLTRHRGGSLRAIGSMQQGRPDGAWQLFTEDGWPFASGQLRGERLVAWSFPGAAGSPAIADAVVQPWNGTWSAAALAGSPQQPPIQVVLQWIAEVQSPLPAAVVPAPEPPATVAPPAAAPSERLEAPTDPGHFTVREREELETYRRFYRDGFLPRRSELSAQYGGTATEGLGSGDPGLGKSLLGSRLPVTRFPTADGGQLDLDGLRGRKVLLVILRGFTAQVCVYCFAQTRELAPVTARLQQLGCELVVLFPGSRSRFDAFRTACEREFGDSPAPYHMVYDPDLELAKALGIEGNLARPSSLLLDTAGVVRFAYIAESVQNAADRPPASRLLDVVQRLGEAPER